MAKKTSKAGSAKKAPKDVIYECPYTGQNIYIIKATLTDLKQKSTFQNGSKKRLFWIPSEKVRSEHYVDSAAALATVEQALLPSFGMRSWEVFCSFTEPSWSSQILFRAWKGRMELAVLPHLIERIPKPPVWAGRRRTPDEYIEEEDALKLQDREVSNLSLVAWGLKDEYPVPIVSLKWKSPDHKVFHSRKGAWEYATGMAQREVQINKCLLGIGSSGKLLQPFVPSVKMALTVGQQRFVRDGLWVVGQELHWQADRPNLLLELEEQQLTEAAARAAQEEEEAKTAQEEGGEEKNKEKKVPTTGLALFLANQRQAYRDEHVECKNFRQAETELRKVWKTLDPEQKMKWNQQAKSKEDVEEEVEDVDMEQCKEGEEPKQQPEEPKRRIQSPLKFYVQSRRLPYRQQRQLEYPPMTLAETDVELREIWKTVSDDEKQEWKRRLQEHEIMSSPQKASKVIQVEEAPPTRTQILSPVVAAASQTASDQPAVQKLQPKVELSATTTTTAPDANTKPVANNDSDETAQAAVQPASSQVLYEEEKKEDDSLADGKPAAADSHEPPIESVKSAPQNADAKTAISVEDCITNDSSNDTAAAAAPPICSSVASLPQNDNAQMITGNSTADLPVTDQESTTAATAPAAKLPQQTSFVLPNPAAIVSKSTKKTARKSSGRRKPPTIQATRRWCLNEDQMQLCYDACMEHYESVMRTVKIRDLSRELEDGFDVLRERGRGRFDMELQAFESPVFKFLTDLNKAPWMPIVRATLGDEVMLIHKGCFLSLPGAEAQEYHQDGVHLTKATQRPCHAINVFVPLVDLSTRNGPTEFCLGSHILGHEGYDRDFVEIPKPKAGTPVIFDYRLGHRGMGNSSQTCRPIIYCTYARAADGKEFRDSVNFSRKRYHKIGDMIEKPLSREERRNKRKREIENRQAEQELNTAMELSRQQEDGKQPKLHDEVEQKTKLQDEAEQKTKLHDEAEQKIKLHDEAEQKVKLHEEAIAMAMETPDQTFLV